MPMGHELLTVNDSTASILTTDGDTKPSTLNISIQNLSEDYYIYLGDSTVTSSSFGFKLYPMSGIVFENLRKSTEIYGISENGDIDVAIMRFVFS